MLQSLEMGIQICDSSSLVKRREKKPAKPDT